MKLVFALFLTLLLGASKVWLWGCVGGRYWWFSPPTLWLISWKLGHNHAITIITNEFHKFWCIFDLRNNLSKIYPKRTLFGPEGQSPPDRHTFCGILAWDFTNFIQREKSSHSNGLNQEMHNLDLEGLNPYPKEKPTWAMVKYSTDTLSNIDP